MRTSKTPGKWVPCAFEDATGVLIGGTPYPFPCAARKLSRAIEVEEKTLEECRKMVEAKGQVMKDIKAVLFMRMMRSGIACLGDR